MKLPIKMNAFDVVCAVGKVCMITGTIINFATGKKADEKHLDEAIKRYFESKNKN